MPQPLAPSLYTNFNIATPVGEVDPYRRIAEFYDCEHADFQDDIQFYLRALPEGPVLDVGTGTGRVASSLADAGYTVHGIDPSPSMLERAHERAGESGNPHFASGSLSDLPVDSHFSSVVLSLNTLWHVTEQWDQIAALRNVGRVLEPRGLVFIDLTNPLAMADRGANGQIRERFRGPCSDSLLIVQSAAWDDQSTQLLHLELTYDCVSSSGSVQRTPASLVLRYLYRSEIELMLRLAGLRLHEVFGSYDMDPFDGAGENMLVVASRD